LNFIPETSNILVRVGALRCYREVRKTSPCDDHP
jgi:hypothetical protein